MSELVYVTNAGKHCKFSERGKRRLHKKPNGTEMKACRPWLEAEIHSIKPDHRAPGRQSILARTCPTGLSSATMPSAPIFIVGCPGSGTSLLRQVLDRHPSLAICNETHFYRLVYLRRKTFGNLSDPANRERLIRVYLSSREMQRAIPDATALARRLEHEASSYQAMFTSMLSFYADSQGKPRYGEKTPGHALFLETLCEWFPNAVILHMVRDPRGAVASLQRKAWARSSVVANARLWLRLNQAARLFRQRPGYLEVRYEALVQDPAREVRGICSLLGEEYSPAMLLPEEDSTGHIRGARRSRMAVTSEQVDAWRKELTSSQVAQIEWVLGPELESFGYAREGAPASALTMLRGVSYEAFDFARFEMSRLPSVWRRFGSPAISP